VSTDPGDEQTHDGECSHDTVRGEDAEGVTLHEPGVTAIAAMPVTAAATMPARNGMANPDGSPWAATPRPL
jgi:hypothetical protein